MPSNDRYEADMAYAAETYADAVAVVTDVAGPAYVTQLGGMCLAIERTLVRGWLWVTDQHDNLPWNREEHHTGWSVGVYTGDLESDDGSDPRVFLSVDDPSLEGLRTLLTRALEQEDPR